MTLEELFQELRNKLKEAHVVSCGLEANWIISKFCNIDELDRIKDPKQIIESEIIEKCQAALEKRLRGEPLAYILEEKQFFGLDFHVDSRVLIPRPESELIVQWSIEKFKELSQRPNFKTNKPLRGLDIGTGSGCLALSLLNSVENLEFCAVDTSRPALDVAKVNSEKFGLLKRIEFFHINEKLEALKFGNTKFDLVVANLPYIAEGDKNVELAVMEHEPKEALYSGKDGLHSIRSWLKKLPPLLAPSQALVAFEIGADQGEAVKSLFEELNIFSDIYLLKDYAGHDRVVCGEIK